MSKQMKQLISLLLVVVMLSAFLPVGAIQASAEETSVMDYSNCTQISVGDRVDVHTGRYYIREESHGDVYLYNYDYFRFIPEQDGVYFFRDWNHVESETSFSILNANGDTVADEWSWDRSGGSSTPDEPGYDNYQSSRCLDFEAKAGETYYLKAYSRESEMSCNLYLEKATGVQSLSFGENKAFSMSAFSSRELPLSVSPDNYRLSLLKCTSSDESVATIEKSFGGLDVKSGKKTGTAVLTVTDPDGKSASATVTVTPYELKNEVEYRYDYNYDYDYYIAVRDFTFAPEESGWYRFSAEGSYVDQTSGSTLSLDAEIESIDQEYYGGEPIHYCNARETYYICVTSERFFEEYSEVELSLNTEKLVAPQSIAFAKGEEMTVKLWDKSTWLDLTAQPSNAYLDPKDVTLSSSDPDVASVDENYMSEGVFVSFRAAGETDITATTTSGLTATLHLTVTPPSGEVIGLDETRQIKRYQFMQFTPETDGYYFFAPVSSDGLYYSGRLRDENGDVCAYTPGNFTQKPLVARCTAGKPYFFEISGVSDYEDDMGGGDDYKYNDSMFDFTITSVPNATSTIAFSCGDSVELALGERLKVSLVKQPADSYCGNVSIYSEEWGYVNIEREDDYCYLVPRKPGNVRLVAKTEIGLTAYCTVTITAPKTIEVTPSHPATVKSGQYVTFTPATSDYYYFYSEGDQSFYAELYDEDFNYLSSGDIFYNYDFSYWCEAGKTYYLSTTLYESSDPDAEYTFGVHRDYEELLRGDVDNDGVVTINDATIIQRYLAEYEVEDVYLVKKCGDINGNRKPTISDVTEIQRYLAGFPEDYPIGMSIS